MAKRTAQPDIVYPGTAAGGMSEATLRPAVDPPSHDDDPLLSPAEVARRMGRHPQTITNWLNDGLLEHTNEPGGRRRVRLSVVNRFLRGTNLPIKEI